MSVNINVDEHGVAETSRLRTSGIDRVNTEPGRRQRSPSMPRIGTRTASMPPHHASPLKGMALTMEDILQKAFRHSNPLSLRATHLSSDVDWDDIDSKLSSRSSRESFELHPPSRHSSHSSVIHHWPSSSLDAHSPSTTLPKHDERVHVHEVPDPKYQLTHSSSKASSEDDSFKMTSTPGYTKMFFDPLFQFYVYILLGIPMVYFSRVSRLFDEMHFTIKEFKDLVIQTGPGASNFHGPSRYHHSDELALPYRRMKQSWEAFVDSLIKEWKTLNIVSALLLGAILTLLQIEGTADDPFIKYSALLALVCALVSLLYGCIYIIRFGSLRRTYVAAEWALEAKKLRVVMNIWVLLSLPAVWLTWSILLYLACIMSYVWRDIPSTINSSETTADWQRFIHGARIGISLVFGIAIGYGILVLIAFGRWGHKLEEQWEARIDRLEVRVRNSKHNTPELPHQRGGEELKDAAEPDTTIYLVSPTASQPNTAKLSMKGSPSSQRPSVMAIYGPHPIQDEPKDVLGDEIGLSREHGRPTSAEEYVSDQETAVPDSPQSGLVDMPLSPRHSQRIGAASRSGTSMSTSTPSSSSDAKKLARLSRHHPMDPNSVPRTEPKGKPVAKSGSTYELMEIEEGNRSQNRSSSPNTMSSESS